jgi:ribosome biogenesis GTPase
MDFEPTAPQIELRDVGWKPVFQQQLVDYPEDLCPARVVVVQRTGLTVAPAFNGRTDVAIGGRFYLEDVEARPTVGDWVLVDPQTGALEAVLERTSLIKRLSPGGTGEVQLIAANIDTAFIVTSCNTDFSIPRLERYMSVVLEAGIQPVIVLTKADLLEDADVYLDQARTLGADVPVEAVNALDIDELQDLAAWCTAGQSIALLGSSGVGKSTLVNTLAGNAVQLTKAVRADDDKGRHTTTNRSLHVLPQGGVILDSPGMREFQLAEAEQGVGSLFADIEDLATSCRFNDCGHGSEPGCAVQAALADGTLDERRLSSYFKLVREERFNRETVAERHTRSRQFGKMARSALAQSHKKRE